MPLLSTVARVQERLGFESNLADVDKSIELALETATEVVSDMMRSHVSRATVVDVFFVKDSFVYQRKPLDVRTSRPTAFTNLMSTPTQVTLKLGRGFVDSGETLGVYVADTYQDVQDSAVRTDIGPSADVNFSMMEWEKGELKIVDYILEDTYVMVTYTAGFEDNDGSPEIYTGVPLWLKNAAELAAISALSSSAVYATAETDINLKEVHKNVETLVLSHARYMPLATKTMQSTVTNV